MDAPTSTPCFCVGVDGPCDNEGAVWRRQNTKYRDDYLNWVYMCDPCFETTQKEWDIMWRSYYSDTI